MVAEPTDETADESRTMMSRTPRRTKTAVAALLALAGLAGTAACSSASSTTSAAGTPAGTTSSTPSGTAALQPLRIALDWTPNVDFLGIYAAISNGYFAKEGINPVIIPYSGTPGETLLSAGKADLAFTYPPNIPAYRASGLKYRAVAGLPGQHHRDRRAQVLAVYQPGAAVRAALWRLRRPERPADPQGRHGESRRQESRLQGGRALYLRLPGAGVQAGRVLGDVRRRR